VSSGQAEEVPTMVVSTSHYDNSCSGNIRNEPPKVIASIAKSDVPPEEPTLEEARTWL